VVTSHGSVIDDQARGESQWPLGKA